MAQVIVCESSDEAAETAALKTVNYLGQKIKQNGRATWVLSGGSAPMLAYAIIAERYINKLDWSKLWIILGDERSVPNNDPRSNWKQIESILLSKLKAPPGQLLKPDYDLSSEEAAKRYTKLIRQNLVIDKAYPVFDVLWLGLGEDGHTLSLFPGQDSLLKKDIVLPIHKAPKGPPDRISLSLSALTNTSQCLIIATGEAKAEVFSKITKGDTSLPITRAINKVEAGGGQVTWLVDNHAAAKS